MTCKQMSNRTYINNTVSSLKDLHISKSHEKEGVVKYQMPNASLPTCNEIHKIHQVEITAAKPDKLDYVSEIKKSDVLFGAQCEENTKFKDLLNQNRPEYFRAIKMKKLAIARRVVEQIKRSDPPGRFLRLEEESGRWYEVDDRFAAKETGKVLGEGIFEEGRTNESIADDQDESRIPEDLASTNSDDSTKKRKHGSNASDMCFNLPSIKVPRCDVFTANDVRSQMNSPVLNKIANYLAANQITSRNTVLPILPPCDFDKISPTFRPFGGIMHEPQHARLPQLHPIQVAELLKNGTENTVEDPYFRAEAMRKSFHSALVHSRNIMNLKALASNERNIDKLIRDDQSDIDRTILLSAGCNADLNKFFNKVINDQSSEVLAQSPASVMSNKSNNKICSAKASSSDSVSSSEDKSCDEKYSSSEVDESKFVEIRPHDILCGRGGMTNNHFGNKRFRKLVDLHRQDYIDAPKIKKPEVARLIVKTIRSDAPAGRFLKKDTKAGKWYEISEKEAAAKASQALREKLHLRN